MTSTQFVQRHYRQMVQYPLSEDAKWIGRPTLFKRLGVVYLVGLLVLLFIDATPFNTVDVWLGYHLLCVGPLALLIDYLLKAPNLEKISFHYRHLAVGKALQMRILEPIDIISDGTRHYAELPLSNGSATVEWWNDCENGIRITAQCSPQHIALLQARLRNLQNRSTWPWHVDEQTTYETVWSARLSAPQGFEKSCTTDGGLVTAALMLVDPNHDPSLGEGRWSTLLGIPRIASLKMFDVMTFGVMVVISAGFLGLFRSLSGSNDVSHTWIFLIYSMMAAIWAILACAKIIISLKQLWRKPTLDKIVIDAQGLHLQAQTTATICWAQPFWIQVSKPSNPEFGTPALRLRQGDTAITLTTNLPPVYIPKDALHLNQEGIYLDPVSWLEILHQSRKFKALHSYEHTMYDERC